MTNFEIPNLGMNGYVAPPSFLAKNGQAIAFAGIVVLLLALCFWLYNKYNLSIEKRNPLAETKD